MSPTTESARESGRVPASPASSSGKPSAESSPQLRRELLRLLHSVVKDPDRAYTAYEEIMSAAGESVVVQIGSRIDVLSSRMDGLNARIDALAESTNARIDALAESTNARIDALAESTNARIDALAEGMNARMDALATIVARMDTRLERLENQQSRLIWGVLGLQATLVVAIIAFLLSV